MALIKVRFTNTESGQRIPKEYIWYCPACKKRHKHPVKGNKALRTKNCVLSGSVLKPSLDLSFIFQVRVGSLGLESEESIVCYSRIENGKIVYGKESTHSFAGETIDMIDLDIVQKQEDENAMVFSTMDSKTLYGKFIGVRGSGMVISKSEMRERDRDYAQC